MIVQFFCNSDLFWRIFFIYKTNRLALLLFMEWLKVEKLPEILFKFINRHCNDTEPKVPQNLIDASISMIATIDDSIYFYNCGIVIEFHHAEFFTVFIKE